MSRGKVRVTEEQDPGKMTIEEHMVDLQCLDVEETGELLGLHFLQLEVLNGGREVLHWTSGESEEQRSDA